MPSRDDMPVLPGGIHPVKIGSREIQGLADLDAATTAVLAATNAAQIWASKTLIGQNEIGYKQGMVVAALQAAAPLIEAEATARERQRTEAAEAVAVQAEDYVRDEVPRLIQEAVASERQRVRQAAHSGETFSIDGRKFYFVPADLLDGDDDA